MKLLPQFDVIAIGSEKTQNDKDSRVLFVEIAVLFFSVQAVVDAKHRVLIFSSLSRDELHDFYTYIISKTCDYLKKLEGHNPQYQ